MTSKDTPISKESIERYMRSQKYPTLKFKKLSEKAFAPQRGTPGSSGLDVFSPIDVSILPHSDALIPLDLTFEIPFGWDISVYNKSGVAVKLKLDKGAELIDSDYRGNCHVHLFNNSDKQVNIKVGQKIAQFVMREVWMGDLEEVDEISTDTSRGTGGFGSTGTQATPSTHHPIK
jgi:dUTP pyrophosphatase